METTAVGSSTGETDRWVQMLFPTLEISGNTNVLGKLSILAP